MEKTILIDLEHQVATCCVCEERRPIARSLLRDQHAMLEFADEIAVDHRECAASPADPERAKRNRTWRKGIERAKRDQMRKNTLDRLTHTTFPLREAA